MQHYVIKFVSDLRQVGGFLRVLRFPPPKKNDRHDITEIVESGVKHHSHNLKKHNMALQFQESDMKTFPVKKNQHVVGL